MNPDDWNQCLPATTTGNGVTALEQRRGRQERARLVDPLKVDRLPPHSVEAEQGVLGCCLLSPMDCIAQARKRLKDIEGIEFYDLRHREIWVTLGRMYDDRLAGKPICSTHTDGIDMITVMQRLKDYGKLEEAGGRAFVAGLPDAVPSAANLDYYLDIMARQFAARRTVVICTEAVGRVYEYPDQVDHFLELLQHDFDRLLVSRQHEDEMPTRIKRADLWGQQVWEEYTGVHADDEGGWNLPIDFKLRIRKQECTVVTGDDGSGKSTFLNYAALHLAQQGAKVLIASFEMPPKKTLRMLLTQLVGTREFQPDENDRNAPGKIFRDALDWISKRFFIYDFLGIADWRELLTVFRYAARHLGVDVFILDSVMRIGIADDDYGTQGLAGQQFANFSQADKAHLFLVIHENKTSEGKAKIRGSKLWTANADNILKIERNMKKQIKLDDLWAEEQTIQERINAAKAAGRNTDRDEEAIKATRNEREEQKKKWDARAVLLKQREMGTQQNAGKYFYYSGKTFQYREKHSDPDEDWLKKWSKPEPAHNGEATHNGEAHRPPSQFDGVADNFPAGKPAPPANGEVTL